MSKTPLELLDGETHLTTFTPSRATYIKEHMMLAAIGSVIAVLVLKWMGDPNLWVGIVGAIAAIGLRGVYVLSEAMEMEWHLTDQRVVGPALRNIHLRDITKINTIFSAAQIITKTGDKHLMKYMSAPVAVRDEILATKDKFEAKRP
ncbi:MAG: hypothetical protein ACPGVK_03105 [Halocynthiibacter sp.]